VLKSRDVNWAWIPSDNHSGLTLAADSTCQPCASSDVYNRGGVSVGYWRSGPAWQGHPV